MYCYISFYSEDSIVVSPERKLMKISAGLALVKEGKILLAHPTNAPWKMSFSIPKGEIEEDEDILNAAIRETHEEVGISVPRELILPNQLSVYYRKSKDGRVYKMVYYFVANVNSLNLPDILPKSQLQIEEVDYAKFFDKEEAIVVMMFKQLPILKSF